MNADDLRYVFGRLDPDHYVPLAEQARRAWDGGASGFELCYQPGDATSYGLVFTIVGRDLPLLGAPGGGSGGMAPTSALDWKRSGEHAIVCYAQKETAMIVGRHEFVHPSRVHPKLTDNAASALALAVLLNEITMPGDHRWRYGMIQAAEAESLTPA